MVSRVSSNLFIKKSIRIAAILIELLAVMCLSASCGEKQSQKEVFQIFREYDEVGFDVDAYISGAKENGTYIGDNTFLISADSTEGKIEEFIMVPKEKLMLLGVVYDGIENAKKAYKYIVEDSTPCLMPLSSIVRVDNVVLWNNPSSDSFDFKDELEKITKVSADEGVHKQLFDESCAVSTKTDKTAEEIVDVLKEKGFDRVYYQSSNISSYLLLNEKSQAINIYVVEDLSSPSEWLSYWMESHTNAKFVYSYKNGTLIAAIGVTVDPEPLLK